MMTSQIKLSFSSSQKWEVEERIDSGAKFWVLHWSGDVLAYFAHPWMAEKARIAADKHIGNPNLYEGTKLSENFQRRVNRIISRTVPCDTCGSKSGSACRRPSEHVTMYENPHEDRLNRMDSFLIANSGGES